MWGILLLPKIIRLYWRHSKRYIPKIYEAAGEAFNIAYGGQEYLLDVYHLLTDALHINIEPIFGPDRPGDIKHSNADIGKAKKRLGYAPDWDFARGIQAAIDWYKENLI